MSRQALDADRPAIEALLTENSLPLAGACDNARSFWVAVDGAEVVGSAGIEVYGSVALPRSVAVRQRYRSTGIASMVIEVVTAVAAGSGIETFQLLTTTAKGCFQAHGFTVVERAVVPDELRRQMW